VLVLDVDHMRQFNDRNGFPAGDAMLRYVASSMRSILPRSALLFRLGSNEFGAILPDTERRRAYDLVEEVRDAVARHAFRPYGEEADVHGAGIVSACAGSPAHPCVAVVLSDARMRRGDTVLVVKAKIAPCYCPVKISPALALP